jgi:ATP-dependent RNA helicase RhlE
MTNNSFSELGIAEPIAQTLAKNNYNTPTPIQQIAIPILLKKQDLLGIAQTGTGKTAAFALPILQHLSQGLSNKKHRNVRALILAPTRELAIQIADNCKIYSERLSLRQTTIYGGVSENPQITALKNGVDLIIATPGRLLDLMNQGHADLSNVECLVLDEADHMLDMGFIKDIRKIIAKIPSKRHTMLFSATMPETIKNLADSILTNPKIASITPEVVTVKKIQQIVYLVDKADKRALLVTILKDQNINKVIVFSKTKHGANRIVQELEHAAILSAAIHGNKSQTARLKALSAFKNGEIRVLVATDIAARGIDIDNISHVINYDLPNEAESYVHRIGRTARAGAEGNAISFLDRTEYNLLKNIEKVIKIKLPIMPTPELDRLVPLLAVQKPQTQPSKKSNRPEQGERPKKNKNRLSAKTPNGNKSNNWNNNKKRKPKGHRSDSKKPSSLS